MHVHRARYNTWACLCLTAALAMTFALSLVPAQAGEDAKDARVEWLGYEQGLVRAGETGRFVLVDFYTTWCRDCKKMEKDTFADPEVVRILSEKFTAVKVDGDQRPELTSMFGVFAYPTLSLLAPDGSRICQRIGYISPADMKAMLEYATSGAYKSTGLNEYVRDRAAGGKR